MNSGHDSTGSGPPLCGFAATRWTLVLRAHSESAESRAALAELCETYYTPVLAYLRREGRDEDAARELAQEFFARLLAPVTDSTTCKRVAADSVPFCSAR